MMKKKRKKKITKAILQKREKRLEKREFKKRIDHWKSGIVERDRGLCQKCLKAVLDKKNQNIHHIISLQNVKRIFPALLDNINNGILLCSFCHKFAPDSPHQGGFEWSLWLEKNKPYQYDYIKKYIYDNED
jgi:5-methylcytosine-specific restriction endonuclease McrA